MAVSTGHRNIGQVVPDMQNAAGQGVGPAERDRLDQLGRRPAVAPPVLDADTEPRQPRLTVGPQASRSVSGVRTKPGCTPNTRTPLSSTSLASTSVSLATPAFAAAKADTCTPSRSPRLPYTVTNRPALRASPTPGSPPRRLDTGHQSPNPFKGMLTVLG